MQAASEWAEEGGAVGSHTYDEVAAMGGGLLGLLQCRDSLVACASSAIQLLLHAHMKSQCRSATHSIDQLLCDAFNLRRCWKDCYCRGSSSSHPSPRPARDLYHAVEGAEQPETNGDSSALWQQQVWPADR